MAVMKEANYRVFRIVPGEKDIQLQALDVLKKWTEESWNLNDYLFVNRSEESALIKKFETVVKL
jgi:hypothetical protein